MAGSSPQLPNPLTPMAFLPPDIATQFQVSQYVYSATLGAGIWDVAINLGNDYRLLTRYPVRFPTVVYFLSRIFTMAYILTSLIFQVGDIPNCGALQIALGVCYVLSTSSTAMLFLLRVLAVWQGNWLAKAVFCFLWVGVTGCATVVPIGIRGSHIGPTLQCINSDVPTYTEATIIVSLINDSAIFFAVTYRILAFTMVDDSLKAQAKAFFKGSSLSRLSYALLQGGQHYYLVAVCCNIVILLLVRLPNIQPVYRAFLTIPAAFTINAMACIVFRKIRFGVIASDGTTTYAGQTVSSSYFRAGGRQGESLPLHYHRQDVAKDHQSTFTLQNTMDKPSQQDLGVHVVKDMHTASDEQDAKAKFQIDC